MNYLYVCNTSSDFISKVNLNEFKEEKRIFLKSGNANDRIGPHGICLNDKKIITANNYNNSISILDMEKGVEEGNCYIGVHCNDVVVFGKNAYIICGDLNNLVVFDLEQREIITQIPCGSLPHSICLNKERKLLLISNMEDDSITLIDCVNNENIKNIRVGEYPTKAVFTVDGQYAVICESNIGADFRGSIALMSLKNYKIINRITVGNSPVDMFCNERFCFVSNFGDGTISIVDINCYKENRNIIVGGMPRGIIKYGDSIYIGDNYNNLLIKVNITNESKKYIPIGGEPTGMILI
ncbi:YncE family protein [Clostridium sp. P21]|uniref:YncE family protein n=1 Tax=Clostridium muellerianum TaxID=2716538 RepID=A0A7Y0HMQ3_9CLOT|nr:YncE family protein [Clostridium muellerianum]NMM63179.1 YncE family protein [Clostridium muellerianum]